jgi:DNA-binding MarR family transcriptional regulator
MYDQLEYYCYWQWMREADGMVQHTSTGVLLREVARLHTHLQRVNVACCDGTTVTQCTLLTELGRSGPVPLADLSRRIGFDKSWTSRAVEHQVQAGLIEKVQSQTDRRMVRLSLTAAGEQRVQDLNGTLNGLADHVMERIPLLEQEGVQRALEWLLEALQAEVGHPSLPQTTAALATLSQEGAGRCTCD